MQGVQILDKKRSQFVVVQAEHLWGRRHSAVLNRFQEVEIHVNMLNSVGKSAQIDRIDVVPKAVQFLQFQSVPR
jgi:hypothetical protein